MSEASAGPLLMGGVAVVTGAGAGIGAAIADLFALHGAHVVAVDIDQDLATKRASAIVEAGGEAQGVRCDVRDAADVSALHDLVVAEHAKVDVLVNNVGYWVDDLGSFVGSGEQHWHALHEINFLHVLRVTHAFLPGMIDRRRGSIVNVSSVEGMRAYPRDPVYGAYKAAVIQFTRSLGVDVGRFGVRVNAIAPDQTKSAVCRFDEWIPEDQLHLWPIWVPVGRMGVGADQAAVALFLASDLSGFVTGCTIPTDGGTGAAGGWYRQGPSSDQWTNRPVAP